MSERARAEGLSLKIWVRDVQIFGASSLRHFCVSFFFFFYIYIRGGPLHAWQTFAQIGATTLHKSIRSVARSLQKQSLVQNFHLFWISIITEPSFSVAAGSSVVGREYCRRFQRGVRSTSFIQVRHMLHQSQTESWRVAQT